jgi:hypothetical protein
MTDEKRKQVDELITEAHRWLLTPSAAPPLELSRTASNLAIALMLREMMERKG